MPKVARTFFAVVLLTVFSETTSYSASPFTARERQNLQDDIQATQGALDYVDMLLGHAKQGDIIFESTTSSTMGTIPIPVTQRELGKLMFYLVATGTIQQADIPSAIHAFTARSRGLVQTLRTRRQQLAQQLAKDRSRLDALNKGALPDKPWLYGVAPPRSKPQPKDPWWYGKWPDGATAGSPAQQSANPPAQPQVTRAQDYGPPGQFFCCDYVHPYYKKQTCDPMNQPPRCSSVGGTAHYNSYCSTITAHCTPNGQ